MHSEPLFPLSFSTFWSVFVAFNGEKSDCGNTGPAEISQTRGEGVIVVRRGLSEFSVTSGKELISPSMVAATATASPHTAFSPQHVSSLRGLDVGRVGWFSAHGNLFPCLGCKQQSLQVRLRSRFKCFRAELCTDAGSSCEKACWCEGWVSLEPGDWLAQWRLGWPRSLKERLGQWPPHLQFLPSSVA